jgi:hypothetical protein
VINQRHYKIDSNDCKAWNAAIYNGDATVNNPPLSLRPREAPSKKKRKSAQMYSSDPEDTFVARNFMRYTPNLHFHVSNESNTKSNQKTVTYISSSPPSKSPKGTTAATISAESAESPSSVIDLTTGFDDSIDYLEEYIGWHIERKPKDADDFSEALQSLRAQRIDFATLLLVTVATWKDVGIPLGIGLRLINDLKAFRNDITTRGFFIPLLCC